MTACAKPKCGGQVRDKPRDKTMSWKTAEHGIRYREHATRRTNGRPDRYYVVRYRVDGRGHDEPVGWVSEGHTLEEARTVRNAARNARQKGVTLKEQRAAEQAARAARPAVLTVSNLWARYLVEVVALNKPRTAAEK